MIILPIPYPLLQRMVVLKEALQVRIAAAAALGSQPFQQAKAGYPYYNDVVQLVYEPRTEKDPFNLIDVNISEALDGICAEPLKENVVTDKALFYKTAERFLDHKRQKGRAVGTSMLRGIPKEDFHLVADKLMYVIGNTDPTYQSYHSVHTVIAPGVEVLAGLSIKEGLDLLVDSAVEEQGKAGFKAKMVFAALPLYPLAILILLTSLFTPAYSAPSARAGGRPNIVLILADDLGYGDLTCYNPESKIPTPHLDKLALQGMRFTDAHSPATVCTPTRYSLMTGGLCFRTGSSPVFTGVGGACLIRDAQLTLPDMLKEAGYATAMTGKWHIGLTFYDKQGQPIHQNGMEGVRRIDYSKPMDGGPLDHGFQQFFGTASCPTTDFLYAYIEGDRVPNPPSSVIDKSRYPKDAYTKDFRDGLVSEEFDASEVDMVFLEKSRAFLRGHIQSKPEQPFFLFHSMQAVHLPSIPAESFRGKTGSGPHGDFIHQMDWIVGELTRELEALGVAENTLVIFCSDNGPEVPTVLNMRKTYRHDGARPWRGVKRDAWEGGHRTPLIVKWPGRVAAGNVSDQLVSLTDLFATTAAIIKRDLPIDAAVDSYNMLPVLEGKAIDGMLRPYMLQQTHWEQALSIRVGQWKYLDHKGSGGNSYDSEDPEWGMRPYQLPETAPDAPGQLYSLASDPGETTNLYFKNPEIAKRLKDLLDKVVASDRRSWIQISESLPAPVPSE